MTNRDFFDSISVMKMVKHITDFLFAAVLSVFLVFILMNIIYSKREEMKLGLMSKLSDLKISLREVYGQGYSKAFAYKLVNKSNKIS